MRRYREVKKKKIIASEFEEQANKEAGKRQKGWDHTVGQIKTKTFFAENLKKKVRGGVCFSVFGGGEKAREGGRQKTVHSGKTKVVLVWVKGSASKVL